VGEHYEPFAQASEPEPRNAYVKPGWHPYVAESPSDLPFWRVSASSSDGARRVSFAGCSTLEEARRLLIQHRADPKNAGLAEWGIVRYEPLVRMTVEPDDSRDDVPVGGAS
jgi:hypothetical protein